MASLGFGRFWENCRLYGGYLAMKGNSRETYWTIVRKTLEKFLIVFVKRQQRSTKRHSRTQKRPTQSKKHRFRGTHSTKGKQAGADSMLHHTGNSQKGCGKGAPNDPSVGKPWVRRIQGSQGHLQNKNFSKLRGGEWYILFPTLARCRPYLEYLRPRPTC